MVDSPSIHQLSKVEDITTEDGDRLLLVPGALSEQELLDSLRDPSVGALCSFVGTTRNSFQGREVVRLEYEAYPSMALETLKDIFQNLRAAAKRGTEPFTAATSIHRVLVAHRLGVVPPSQSSIVIIVSSAHRKESFQACEWVLERVKACVPIWKKEVYAGDQGEGVWKEN